MSEHKILTEWLDGNAARHFPLTDEANGVDTTGTFTLPTNFLLDMFLCAPPDFDPTGFFLSRLVVRARSVQVYISYEDPDTTTVTAVGSFASVPIPSTPFYSFQFTADSQPVGDYAWLELVSGVMIVGYTDQLDQFPGDYAFAHDNGEILSTRVSLGVAGVASIKINDALYTGNLTIQAGDNCVLEPSYDAGTDETTLVINFSPAAADTLVDDDSIITKLTDTFGAPIRAINGMRGDALYNFKLEGSDGASVEPLADLHGVRVVNQEAKPCCDKSTLDACFTELSALNSRYARLESYYDALSSAMNSLQSLVVSLDRS